MTMEKDSLAAYIVDDLFVWFKDERRAQLEPQMRRNYDAFRGKYNSEALKTWRATEGYGWRSKVFVRLTKQKVITGYNQAMAAMLQKGQLPWDIAPTPVPYGLNQTLLPEAEASLRCDGMRKQIRDNLVECKSAQIFSGSTLESVLYGWSWLHGPILRSERKVAVSFGVPGMDMMMTPDLMKQYGRHGLSLETRIRPVVENKPVWNVFWDLENPDHQAGHGIIVREMMSKGRFLDLMDEPGYDKEAIQKIADQFKTDDNSSEEDDDSQGPVREQFNKRRRVIPVFFFYGRVPRRYLSAYENETLPELSGSESSSEVEIFTVLSKCKNALTIRPPRLNMMPYRPLYLAKWESLPNEAAGVGLPENIEDSQMIVNGLTRALLDNKALAANILMAWNPRKMAPGQNKALYPGKCFEVDESVEVVGNAIEFFAPPDNTRSIPEQIEMFRQFADEESGVARTMEGTNGPKNRTAYEMAKMAEAGNKLIAGNIRNLDQGHIEPTITGFYHYHMITHPDESIKGDFNVEASGYQSYMEKEKRAQDLLSLLSFSLSSEFTAQFTKVVPFLRELAKSRDLDPDKFYPSDTELNEQSEQLARQLPQMRPALPMPQPPEEMQ